MTNSLSALAALADPTRRQVFERLARGPLSVSAITSSVAVSQSAVSQHLSVLRAAGLVRSSAAGTQRIYEIDPAGLGPLRAWLDQLWDQQLAAFKAAAEKDVS